MKSVFLIGILSHFSELPDKKGPGVFVGPFEQNSSEVPRSYFVGVP